MKRDIFIFSNSSATILPFQQAIFPRAIKVALHNFMLFGKNSINMIIAEIENIKAINIFLLLQLLCDRNIETFLMEILYISSPYVL